jgi:hypothetical protein
MGDLSETQQACLDEMRNWVKKEELTSDPFIDDYYLLRFLRARKFDMDKTQLMFTNYLKWREDNGVDDIDTVSTLNSWFKIIVCH